MTAKLRRGSSKRALIALAFPLAALVPLAAPFNAAQVAALGLPGVLARSVTKMGSADAATIKHAKKRKVTVRKSAGLRSVCTASKFKGKLVKRCNTVSILTAPVVVAPVPVNPAPPPPMMSYAPVPSAPPPPHLPYGAAPAMQVPAIAYYWIDQADSYAQAIGNSPPDFSFACGGVDCWAWISRDGEVLIVEPARDGVLQYFFAPRQTSPYLARDSYSSFAFDGRDLVQVYDNQGRIYTGGLSSRARYDGQALQQRGRALFAASLRQRRWDRGSATAWNAQYADYGFYDGWNSGWGGWWRDLPDWERYEHDHRHQHPPRHLDDEHRDRDDARRRFENWHRHGDQGAPPPTGNPVVNPSLGDSGPGAVTPPRPPLPDPPPQPPLTDPPLPVAEIPATPPSDAEQPRRPRPRRDLESEPDTPAIPRRGYVPPGDQPAVQIQAVPQPAPSPAPAPAPVPDPVLVPPPLPTPEPQWQIPPPPAPVPQYVESAPVAAPAPAPAAAPAPAPTPQPDPPPPVSPAYDHIKAERPSGDTEQP